MTTLGGLTLNVLEAGAEHEHTLLLIHGFLDCAWTWEPLLEHGLGARFHVLAPDLRGHGDSDRVGAGGYYHFFDYLPDLAAVVEQLAPGRLSVVGHSMGGTLAGYFAGLWPERVSRLVLLEGLGPPEDSTALPDRVRGWVDGWQRRLAAPPKRYPSVEAAEERMMAFDPLLDAARARRLAELSTRRLPDGQLEFKHDPLHLTRGPHAFRVEAAAELWARVTCPVLYVEGAASSYRAMGDELDRRLAHFSHIERRLLPAAGHMMQRHAPAALAELITRHVGE